MLLAFLYIHGVVHYEFLSPGQTLNGTFCVDVLKYLTDHMRRMQPNVYRDDGRLLNHDKHSAHSSVISREFLPRNSITW